MISHLVALIVGFAAGVILYYPKKNPESVKCKSRIAPYV